MQIKNIKGTRKIIFTIPLRVEKDMAMIVELSTAEVAWLGELKIIKDTKDVLELKLLDIHIPGQDVTSVTADISEDDLAEMCNELDKSGHSSDLIRFHGHSHVNMGVGPSSTDNNTFKEFYEECDKYFARIIINKKGDYRLDFADKVSGLIYEDIEYVNEDVVPTHTKKVLKEILKDKVRTKPIHTYGLSTGYNKMTSYESLFDYGKSKSKSKKQTPFYDKGERYVYCAGCGSKKKLSLVNLYKGEYYCYPCEREDKDFIKQLKAIQKDETKAIDLTNCEGCGEVEPLYTYSGAPTIELCKSCFIRTYGRKPIPSEGV